jgi:hypothetical protein
VILVFFFGSDRTNDGLDEFQIMERKNEAKTTIVEDVSNETQRVEQRARG